MRVQFRSTREFKTAIVKELKSFKASRVSWFELVPKDSVQEVLRVQDVVLEKSRRKPQ
jgi:hypothetical protein